ncbi:MAG: hypothetical protein LBD91_04410 [Prevotellaceae bacterium]|jgi:hypothetical protein|nr:hypothetical protein [Prevotellaceae bacterium]
MQCDTRVYGGLFQWGCEWNKTSNATSYPVSVDGTYRRYDGDSIHAVKFAHTAFAHATYDSATGQVLTYDGTNSVAGMHIYPDNAPFDWRGSYAKQKSDLLGNGEKINYNFGNINNGGVYYEDHSGGNRVDG